MKRITCAVMTIVLTILSALALVSADTVSAGFIAYRSESCESVIISDGFMTRYTIDNVTYKVMNVSKRTAMIETADTSAESITIYNKIKIGDITYKVVRINKKAFTKCSNLKSVTIGKYVKTIGNKAFYGCGKLSKVTFKGKKLVTVKKKAFRKTSANLKISAPASVKKLYRKLVRSSGGKL